MNLIYIFKKKRFATSQRRSCLTSGKCTSLARARIMNVKAVGRDVLSTFMDILQLCRIMRLILGFLGLTE